MAQRLVLQRLSLSLSRSLALARRQRPTSTAFITTTRVLREDTTANKDTTTATTAPPPPPPQDDKDKDDNDKDVEDKDECPVWQNPLHHNNPELQKMFPEDFAEGEVMPLVPLPPLAKPGSNVQAPPHVHELCDDLVQLNMLEMKQLMDKIATHFGFDPHAIAMGLGGGLGGATSATGGEEQTEQAATPVVEKTTFDLKLLSFDAKNKIKVIKEVRAIAGLGLKEAKEMVESAPTVIKKDIKKEQAQELQKKLEDIGATIEVV
jgi:large subunit ribosomal protein L7/L12